jgi:hypothetical protein
MCLPVVRLAKMDVVAADHLAEWSRTMMFLFGMESKLAVLLPKAHKFVIVTCSGNSRRWILSQAVEDHHRRRMLHLARYSSNFRR